MVGTIFLWVYWPSFNAAMAAISGAQYRVIINTVLAICGSCISAFYAGRLLRPGKKFDFEELQNATLAGGVAVGSSSDLAIHPWGALLLGNVAGIVSTAGFVFLSPLLDRYLKIHDTCGVHNLHGMPGLLGGIAGAISASTATVAAYGGETILYQIFTGRNPAVKNWDATTQGAYQFAGLMVSVAFAIAGGLLTGFIMRWKIWDPLTADFYEDVSEWTTEHLDGDLNGKTGGHGDLENGHGASPAAGTGAHGSGLEMVGTKHASSAREADPEAVHAATSGVDVAALVQAEVRRALEAAGVYPASPSSVAAPTAAGTPSGAPPVAATNV
jgi:ammonium transporter Rh